LLTACGGGSAGSFCLIYHPVYASDDDSHTTLQQVDANNAAWLALCGQ
jgi:hypothetical protein